MRLLVSGHRVGTRLRAARADHRDLVDIIAQHDRDRVRVLQHPTPTAYCIPGRRARVVLSQGVLDALPPDQQDALRRQWKALTPEQRREWIRTHRRAGDGSR